MAKPNKERISDELFCELLNKELANGNMTAHSKTNFYLLLQTNYSLDKARALKLHDFYYSEWARLQKQAIDIATTNNKIKDVEGQIITRETLLAELDQVKQISLTPDDNGRINAQAVIKAIEVQAKMLGLNEPDKVEAKITGIGASKVIISD